MNYEIPFFYPIDCPVIPLADITLGDRSREHYGDIQELADSFLSLGLVHPPTLTKSNNQLIAGGRRLKAMELIGCTHVPVMYREEMPEHMVFELELEENIKRLNMKWQEKVLLIYRTHSARVDAGAKMGHLWKQSETGALLKVANGHVSHALLIAKFLLTGDEEITNAKNLVEAMGVIMGRKEQEAQKKLAERNNIIKPTNTLPTVNNIPDNHDEPTFIDMSGATLTNDLFDHSVPAPTRQVTPITTAESFDIDLSERFILGDCIEVMKKMPVKSVDHIVTDIPYGINMDNLDQHKNIDLVAHTHQVEQNVEMMPKFLTESYKILKDSGYLVFWYDLDHHEKLHNWAKEIGFQPQRWPLIWVKSHTCRNSAAYKNFTKSTEVAMVLRKSSKASLVQTAQCNFVIADGLVEKKLYDNPFAKPYAVWKFILDTIAFKGQTILDPFAGQMSCARACVNLGLIPTSIEIDPRHFKAGVKMMRELWQEMLQANVNFLNDPTLEIIDQPTEPEQ